MTDPARRPAVFLDRDGTLIEDREYLADPAGVRVLPGVVDGLLRLRNAGFALVVVTNQSGIGRGWMTEDDYRRVADEVARQLRPASLDAVYHCPAAPAPPGTPEHPDRKPLPGLYLRAARDLDLDLPASFAIGDSLRDLVAGHAAGCRAGVLVRTGKSLPADADSLKDWQVVPDFTAAVDWILRSHSGPGSRRL